jgi:metal-responsive CopG/Arc/MetJ family transcriptional regulator
MYPLVSIGRINMAMKKIMVSLPEDMVKVLEKERKDRYLETIPETIRLILSDYLRTKDRSK